MPTLVKDFELLLDKKYLPKATTETPQYCNVQYKADIFSGKVFISVSRIAFSPLQLNYLSWRPDIMSDMRSAAITHYNDTRKAGEPAFVEEKIL